jgi:translation initiation factor 2 subunit 1
MSLDEAYDLIGFPVLDLFTSYQEALESLKENGKDILEEIELDSDDIKNTYLQIIEENVEISTVTIIGKVKLSFITDNGIEQIKEALLGAMKVVEKPKPTRSINISYIGTPYYRLEIVSKDYIDAEGILSEALEIIQGEAEQYNGQFEFLRD